MTIDKSKLRVSIQAFSTSTPRNIRFGVKVQTERKKVIGPHPPISRVTSDLLDR